MFKLQTPKVTAGGQVSRVSVPLSSSKLPVSRRSGATPAVRQTSDVPRPVKEVRKTSVEQENVPGFVIPNAITFFYSLDCRLHFDKVS